MDMEKQLKKLDLFDVMIVEDNILFTTVMKVHNGHIYRSYDKSNQIMGMVFVPVDIKEQ